jgi:AcrR family transcriptional regulator
MARQVRTTSHVLPRGRNAAPRQVVWESQRERLLEAMADAVAEKGFATVAVADVIERAGVSRKTFYEQFENKTECFLAAYDAGVDLMLETIEDANAAAALDPIAAARLGTRAYLELLAGNPGFARTFLIEVLAAGPEALQRRTVIHERFAALLADIHRGIRGRIPAIPEPPPHVFRACVGAINELVTDTLLRRGPEHVLELEEQLLDVQLALLVGGELSEQVRAAAPAPAAH